jgi:hypothetical protein
VKKRWPVPLWVEVVYRFMEWLDYKVLSPMSSRLVWRRNALLDKYCTCERCQERKRTGTP